MLSVYILIIIREEDFSHNVYQIYIKPHSEHVKMTLECQIFNKVIFIRKVLDYAGHFSPLSLIKPYTAKSDGRSYCPRSFSNL